MVCVVFLQAAILTHTTDYISNLEEEKMRLQNQNNKLKCMLEDLSQERDVHDSPPPKRKKRDTGERLQISIVNVKSIKLCAQSYT